MNEALLWFILLILILAGLLGMLFWLSRKDRQYRKKSVGQVMDPQFKEGIDQEIKDAMRRKSKFEQILKKHGN